jgi:L-threonylcarbamoyladenylate synthase
MSRITTNVDLIVAQLHLGNVVALPTETVYGLGADATNERAVKKIFEIKKRPLNHPLIMHVCPSWDLTQWIEELPEYAKKLTKLFWPGPLTLIFKLKKQANISRLITSNQDTIAIRCPSHPLALEVLHKLGRPIVAPSANPFGKISPTEAKHVMQDFPKHSFSILEGGACDVGIESTILYCVHEDTCTILRHGVISQSQIQNFCDVLEPAAIKSSIRVSGNLKQHYQPEKSLFYFKKEDVLSVKNTLLKTHKSYILGFSTLFDKETLNYLFPSCPKEAAKEFYRQLRLADQSNKDIILIELPTENPGWEALIERIKKAGICFTQIGKVPNASSGAKQ